MTLRNIKNEDIISISNIYKKAFDGSYLSTFYSIKHLKAYFEYLIKYNNYSYLAENEGEIVGFLIGGFRTQEATTLFLKKYKSAIVLSWIKNPKFILLAFCKLLRKIFIKKRISREKLRLFIIAVKPEFINQGIGNKLIFKFENELQKDGYKSYGLYVRSNNDNAINFYKKSGFIREFKDYNQYSFVKNIH